VSVTVAVSGSAAAAVDQLVSRLIADQVASGITTLDPSLWGPEAEEEASKRLGWTEAVAISEPLVDEILALRDELREAGITHIVLGGMGGSSLAPEVIANTYGVPLTVLDATDPGQVRAALGDRLAQTAVVISSKSGSTVETDSQKRVYEKSFRDAGIDPLTRIIIVTDPASPLDTAARVAGYRVFNADPTVGGRYSALTAFGLVPSGLAGVDIRQLLDEAQAVELELALDVRENPGLILGAAIAGGAVDGSSPLKDKLGIVADGTHIVGFGDWVEQLVAESTGKLGRGLLPVVLEVDSPELELGLPDLQVVRLVANERETREVREGEIEVSGSLGGQFLVWEYATVVAGRLLGINPFDQPDVESAKIATRGLLDDRPEPVPPLFVEDGIEVRASGGWELHDHTLAGALRLLLGTIPENGYLAVQAYLDRVAHSDAAELRGPLAAHTQRPVTFGWGPRFLHSTGQFHKGGPAVGVFLQLVDAGGNDLEIPDRPFTFGQLIRAQAAGDASVLADHGRPVLTLTLRDVGAGLAAIRELVG
jgi:glucose-6-phosphate isomerase